jgi:hypothetical protein
MRKPDNHIRSAYRPDPPSLTIRKVRVDIVWYGPDTSRDGRTLWGAFDNGQLVCVAATAGECRRRYREITRRNVEAAMRRKEQAANNGNDVNSISGGQKS